MTKERLESYQQLKHEADSIYRICVDLEKEKLRLNSPPHDMPKSTNKRTLEAVMAEYDVMCWKFHQKHLEALRVLKEIEDFIAGLDHVLHQNILRLKYVEGKKWWQVAEQLHYSREHIVRTVAKIFEDAV